eukprot:NODE_150_length_17275_cov_0.559618.p17 type:complete len:102 gc:universal NODE_150_length_17275_cov_0.559618:11938-11633(-)
MCTIPNVLLIFLDITRLTNNCVITFHQLLSLDLNHHIISRKCSEQRAGSTSASDFSRLEIPSLRIWSHLPYLRKRLSTFHAVAKVCTDCMLLWLVSCNHNK